MPLLKADTKRAEKPLQVRIDELIIEQLDRYAEFIKSDKKTVVAKALEYVFMHDKEFQKYLKSQTSSSKKDQS